MAPSPVRDPCLGQSWLRRGGGGLRTVRLPGEEPRSRWAKQFEGRKKWRPSAERCRSSKPHFQYWMTWPGRLATGDKQSGTGGRFVYGPPKATDHCLEAG